MTERKCLFIQALDGGSGEDVRLLNSAIVGGTAFEPLTPGIGAIGRGHGVLTGNALKPTATGTPNNQVQIAAGSAAVRGTQSPSQGSYVVGSDATVAVTISAKHATLSRTDYIVAQVRDSGYAALSGNDWLITTVEGSPGAGVPNVPHDALVIAQVTIHPTTVKPGGPTVIDAIDITDLRPQARATGGVTPVNSRNDMPDPQQDEFIWEIPTQVLLRYNAGSWTHVGSNLSADWTSFSPTLVNVALGANGTKFGRYIRLGRTVTGVAGFFVGTGSVTGSLGVRVPIPVYNPGPNFRYLCAARAFVAGNWYSSTAELNPSFDSTLIFNFATAGTAGWGAAVPAGWGNASLTVFFSYEAA